MQDVSHIETPNDLLNMDEIEIPDFMGLDSPLYLENTFRFTIRIWKFLHENNIDTTKHNPSTLNDEYRSDLDQLSHGLGISMMQYDGAAHAAITIHQNGFPEWYNSYKTIDPDERLTIGENVLDRRWTLTITPTIDDNPYTDAKMVHSHTEQKLRARGVDGTIKWIDGTIDYAKKNTDNPDEDDEIQALLNVRDQLQNGEYEPQLVIMPEDY